MGSHTGKETDPAFAAPIGGLKSSFHFRFILFLVITVKKLFDADASHLQTLYHNLKLSFD